MDRRSNMYILYPNRPGKVSSEIRFGKLTCAAGTMVQRMDASAIDASQKKALRKSFSGTYE